MKRCGFTLAEVLITLSIIGIIAVLTVSPVITSYKEKATVVKLKKIYVELQNGLRLAEMKEGEMKYWDLVDEKENAEGATNFANKFFPYLKISQSCVAQEGCFPDTTYKKLNGGTTSNFNKNTIRAKARLANGASMAFIVNSAHCTRVRGTAKELKKCV